MPGYIDASGINRYQPTDGEQRMLNSFNERQAAVERVAATANPPQPIPGADATGTLPGQAGYNPRATLDPTGTAPGQFGYSPPSSSGFDAAVTGLQSAGTRTERLAYGEALGGMLKKDPSLASSSDLQGAMRRAGTRSARAGFAGAMADQMVRGFAGGGQLTDDQLWELSPLAADRQGMRRHRQQQRAEIVRNVIRGPGTATSDSIPAKVSETGEEILVSNGERIVSAQQEILLKRIAEMLGFESVDAMLEQGTGQPVGPTMKGGKRGAAGGASPDDWMRVHQTGDRDSIDYHPEQPASTAPARGDQAGSNLEPLNGQSTRHGSYPSKLEQLLTGAQVVPGAANVARGDAGPSTVQRQLAAEMASRRGPEQPAPQAQQQHPVAIPASRAAAPAPGSMILGQDDLATRQSMHMIHNNLRSLEDVGSGIVRQVGADGRKMITNVDTGNITDPNKRVIDGNESAAIDRQGSTYNPAKQYENMLRLRAMSDFMDDSITDPSVRARAAAFLGLDANRQQVANQGRLQNAQAAQAEALTGQTQQMEALRGKLLDPKTPPAEQQRILQLLGAKAETPVNLQVHDMEVPLDEKQPLLGMRKVPHSFNPRTGEFRPLQQQPSDPMTQARNAIARGADPAKVNARLKELGLPPLQGGK